MGKCASYFRGTRSLAVEPALGSQLPSQLILRQHVDTTGLLHDALKLRAVDLAVPVDVELLH